MISKLYQSTSLHALLESLNLLFLLLLFLFALLHLYQFPFLLWKLMPNRICNCLVILFERIQPAVVFNDKITIEQILNEYTNDHSIRLFIFMILNIT
jgi:hypothetical protein